MAQCHRFKVVFSLLFYSLLFIFSPPLFAWNAIGHMVVANIAYQHLKPDVKTKVDDLMAHLHQEYPEFNSFVNFAFWPDAIRGQRIETYTRWHYLDVPFSLDDTPINDVPNSDNAVWALNSMQAIVKNDKANPYERARFLAFFAHIVGDLHQPLHSVSAYSRRHPDGDKGGNLYVIYHNGERTNLHKFWDEGAGIFSGDNLSIEHVSELSTLISKHFPESYFREQIANLDPNVWIKEGSSNAKHYAYAVIEDQAISLNYIESSQQLAEKEAALAGYRLAQLLNLLMS